MKSCAVIGGGIVGLAVAYKLLRARPGLRLVLLEKEAGVGRHQSTRNSGVLHAGLYYQPGSIKAQLAVSGIKQMTAFCREHNIPHEICGKVVIAVDEPEVARLHALHQRGQSNGLQGLAWLNPEQLREREPHAAGRAALLVPEEGIVDYAQVCETLRRLILELGGEIRLNFPARKITRQSNTWRIESTSDAVESDFLITCAGLHSDRISRAAGSPAPERIVPFRGEYYHLRPARQNLVHHLIYPVPDPSFPFLGVHFTRMIAGGVEAGPNAVLALKREGYSRHAFNLRDALDAATFPGLWKFAARHARMCAAELARSFSRRLFCQSLQRLVPELRETDLNPGGCGVRAQAMTPQGNLQHDFALREGPHALHLVNAPSPAATASLAIADYLVARLPA